MHRCVSVEWISANVLQMTRVHWWEPVLFPFDVFTHCLPVCFESWQVTNSALHPIGSELQDKTVEYINTILMIHHFRQWRSFCSKYDVISSFLSTTRTYSSNEWVFKEITRPRKDFICFPRCTILFLRQEDCKPVANVTCHCPAQFEPACNCVNLWKKKKEEQGQPEIHNTPLIQESLVYRVRSKLIFTYLLLFPLHCFLTSLSSIIYVPRVQAAQRLRYFPVWVQALTVLRGSKSLSNNRGPIRDCTFPCWLSFLGNGF